MTDLPFPCPLEAAIIQTRRAQILRAVLEQFPALRQAPPPRVPAQALSFMLEAYDKAFLNGLLTRSQEPVSIAGSTRMTRAAGTCSVTQAPRGPAKIEIRMGVDFLLRLGEGPFEANGLLFDTALEAFLSVLEHELCHALDFLLSRRLDRHGPRFRALAQGLFGHQSCTHKLPTRAEDAAHLGCGVGQWVCFPYQGRTLRGRVSRVGKTATVMVPSPDGSWRDDRGQRYDKYLVPPGQPRTSPPE